MPTEDILTLCQLKICRPRIWGRRPPPKKNWNFFLQKRSNIFEQKNFFPIFSFSKVFKFTWKMRNRLYRKKNQISGFSDFYFSSYRENSSKIVVIWVQKWAKKDHNSKNRNRKNLKFDFWFDLIFFSGLVDPSRNR